MPKMPDNLFLTGCDEKTEWQLPWFLENYFKHNNTPIAIGNFGMSDEMVRWCETKSHAFCLMHHDQVGQFEKAWFLKPAAMLKAPGKKITNYLYMIALLTTKTTHHIYFENKIFKK